MSPLTRRDGAIAAGLAVLAIAVFARTVGFGFAGIDDTGYVRSNPNVLGGLGSEAFRWALTTFAQSNWHPLTWLSLQLDATLGGAEPGVYHGTNVLLHAANASLLFLVLRRATGAVWKSTIVAAIFAVHPLHVESVAWISERKDVLSTFFLLAALAAWLRHVERPAATRYAAAVVAFALGLLAKPMLVTLPALLLLLDRWPLRRVGPGAPRGGGLSWARAAAEKVPFLLLAAASGAMTLLAQSRGGAVGSFTTFPLATRLANAAVSGGDYLIGTLWPAGLAVPYPYDLERLTAGRVAASALVLGGITAATLAAWRARPAITVGWSWFVITLLPVIGIVQVGAQARADRYTYVPMIGLLVAGVWGIEGAIARRGEPVRRAFAGAALLAIAALAAVAWVQVGYWRDAETLFRRALAVTKNNAAAQVGLGLDLYERGRMDDARASYEEALRIAPDYLEAHVNLAAVHLREGRFAEGAAHYEAALRISDRPAFRTGLAAALAADAASAMRAGRLDEAEAGFARALRADPRNLAAHKSLGVLLARRGRISEAIPHFEAALAVDPSDEGVRRNLERARGEGPP